MDPRRFALTGAAKGVADTNMTQPSSLGTPLEFDLVGFNFEVQRGLGRVDHNVIYNNCLYTWVFGQSTVWVRSKLTRIPEGVGPFGSVASGGAEVSIIANGWPVVQNFYNMTTPDRLARRVTSTESFRLLLDFNAATAFQQGTAAQRITNYMLGLLYAQL